MKKILLAILTATLTLSIFCFAGCKQSSTGELPPCTHTLSDWIIDSQPGCGKTGLKHKECTVCKETLKTATIDALTHEYENYVCKHCGDEYYTAGLQYKLVQGKMCYEVVGIDDLTTTEIIIPSKYNGLPVTIGESAFPNNKVVEKVYIHNGVTSIGDSAFRYCSSLTSITIPDSVTSIGNNSFYGCDNLKYNEYENGYYLGNVSNPYMALIKISTDVESFNINENCKYIYATAFNGCGELKCNEYENGYYIGSNNNSYLWLIDVISTNVESFNINENCKFIFDNVFKGCNKLTSITIPDGIISISEGNFKDCRSLTGITVSESNTNYKSINGNLYSKDGKTLIQYAIGKKDETFTVPNGVLVIGSYAFNGCRNLTKIIISDGVTTICEYALCCVDPNFEGVSVIIPNSVAYIDNNAFSDNSSIYISSLIKYNEYENARYLGNDENPYLWLIRGTGNAVDDVIIHNDCKFIHYAAFSYNIFTTITIPDSVTFIGDSAFSKCYHLTTVYIPENVVNIGDYVFYDCSGLTSINVNENNTSYKSIDGNLYSKDGKTLIQYAAGKTDETFTIPDSVTSIGYSAFEYCRNLTNVDISNSVTSIGNYAFNSCSSLTSVTIPDSVTYVGNSAFNSCSGLTSVTIPDSVTSIGYGTFYGCSKLTSVTIPNGVTSIGDYTFYDCNSLTSVTIPDSVTSIGNSAFSCCSSLTSITISDSVTSIGNNAFYSCDNLTSVTIGNSITSIGNWAFAYCSSLTSVTIGNSVTSIRNWAFGLCDNLENVYYNGTQEEWNKINMEDDWLNKTTKYFYSEEKPTTSGNYWHYVDDTPTIWE